MKYGIINNIRGNDVKPYTGIAYKVANFAPYLKPPQSAVGVAIVTSAASFFPEKGNPMSKKRKPMKFPPKPLPIVVVPNKTYLDATGDVTPTDVILVADPILYQRMQGVLAAWGKEQLGVPGQRGVVEG